MRFVGGLPETVCGAGSTLRHTEGIRAQLPALLRRLGVRTLLDAPCGDFNWLAETDLSDLRYIGIDASRENLAVAAKRDSAPGWAPRSKRLALGDLVTDAMPGADLLLCRDFLQHLPNAEARKVLDNFVAAGIGWLLATSHLNPANEEISRAGDFRPLNLCAPPFALPPPVETIADGEGRVLALWGRESVKR